MSGKGREGKKEMVVEGRGEEVVKQKGHEIVSRLTTTRDKDKFARS